ncbi:MAG: glycosyltransferase family 2 protein [Planctomycetes bacterium]|nr:glycosyltransferase family 2 protein [Planctomycetota bacterium]
MKLSIIIPTFNTAHVIGECLSAILQQVEERRDIQVIAVDDASTDDTVERIKSHGVTVIERATNGGSARSRNLGARHASGTWLIFLDADVLLPAGSLARLERLVDESAEIPGRTFQGVFSADNQVAGLASAFYNYEQHYVQLSMPRTTNYVNTSLFCIRRDEFLAIGGFDEGLRLCEDTEFGLRWWNAGNTVRLVPELAVRHVKSITFRGVTRVLFLSTYVARTLGRRPSSTDAESTNGRPAARSRFFMVKVGTALLHLLGLGLSIAYRNPVPWLLFLAIDLGIKYRFFRHLVTVHRRPMLWIYSWLMLHATGLAMFAGACLATIRSPRLRRRILALPHR